MCTKRHVPKWSLLITAVSWKQSQTSINSTWDKGIVVYACSGTLWCQQQWTVGAQSTLCSRRLSAPWPSCLCSPSAASGLADLLPVQTAASWMLSQKLPWTCHGVLLSWATCHYSLSLVVSLLPWWLSGKESACPCRRPEYDPGARKIPWRRNGNNPVLLPGKSQGQRSLAGYSPQGLLELDKTAIKQQCFPYF